MINLCISNPRVRGSGQSWLVLHPTNDSILAYCTTETEANYAAERITVLARKLRAMEGL